jgi:5-methylcytosine-specific restriction enzyme subunit McrC
VKQTPKHITVYEHETLRVDRGEQRISAAQLEALQVFYGENGVSYYSLVHNGVKFNEYVGVLQVGQTTIEILPKADKSGNAESWRKMLIGMLRASGVFNIQAPSSSNLHVRSNSILDLYFELYIKELEYLVHQGLVKKYRKTESNQNSLKGSLQFSKHIQKNLVHKERFFVKYTTYDKDHTLHQVLFKALKLLKVINTNEALHSRIGSLLLHFHEVSDIKISAALFDKLQFDRKTASYKTSIDIAKLILLNYHPDIKRGRNDVLALMFDMNALWEQFVFTSLRKHKVEDSTVIAQHSRNFWKPESGARSSMKPDIVINKDKANCIVLDTKWKNLNGYNPSPEDLRQMYVYKNYYKAQKVALIYPGMQTSFKSGKYFIEGTSEISESECSIISITVETEIHRWQKAIAEKIREWGGEM